MNVRQRQQLVSDTPKGSPGSALPVSVSSDPSIDPETAGSERTVTADGASTRADATPSASSPGGNRSLDTAFTTLSNRRRRLVLRYLKRNPGETSVRALSERVAAWENDVAPEAVTYRQRKRVYTSLHQTHLPTLAKNGFIEYEPNRGLVSLTPEAADLDVYLEAVGKHEMPWSEYYLGLASVALAATVAVAVGAVPFDAVTGTTLAAAISVVLFVSALAHVVSNRRMRIDHDSWTPR